MVLLEQPQHTIAYVRWVVVSDDSVSTAFSERHFLRLCERVRRVNEHDELVVAQHYGAQARFCRLKGQHAEIEAALRDLGADLPCRNPTNVHVHERVGITEALSKRQNDVDGRFVDPDEDASATQVAELLYGRLRFFGEPEQPVSVIAEEASRDGQRGVFGGAVEQPLADTLLQPPYGLADRRLGPVELHGRP